MLYTPQASYVGPDAFGYTETDINGQTASGTVAVTVTAAVVAPSAVAQTGTVQQGQSIDLNVLTGDTGSGITLTSVTTPQDGTAVIQNGEVLYTAPAAFVGSDSFSYTITGQTGLTATANVTVTVTETPPIANADTATAVEGGTVTINVLAVDIGNGLTLTSVGTPTHGTAVIQNGEVLYTAPHGYVGPNVQLRHHRRAGGDREQHRHDHRNGGVTAGRGAGYRQPRAGHLDPGQRAGE